MKRVSILGAALGSLCCLLALPATAASAAPAAAPTTAAAHVTASSATTTTAPTTTSGQATRLNQSASGISGLPSVQPRNSEFLTAVRGELPAGGGSSSDTHVSAGAAAARLARTNADAKNTAPAASTGTVRAPAAASSTVTDASSGTATAAGGSHGSGVSHGFNGVSDKDSDALIGGPITPPDQGLCVGKDTTLKGSPDAVWEPVNEAAAETTKTGTKLRPDVGLTTIFQDPYFVGDVRCLYDPSSETFYFTEIGYPVASGPASDGNNTVVDVAVVNSKGAAQYQFDTSLNGTCFGDQPKTGFDNNALVISTDEYCGTTESDYEGADVVVISKPELAAEDATVSDDQIGPVSIAGNPVTGLDPAINTGGGTEYFVDSTSFLGAADTPAASADNLGLTTLTDTASVTTGKGKPELASRVIPSEEYVYPVNADSTGSGSTTTLSDGTVVTSESAIQPDDDRTSGPVNVTTDRDGGIELWTSVDTAITPRGDTTTRDGDAWFEISIAKQKVVKQGYIAVKGAYLVYPAVEASKDGQVAQVFTITSPTINPSPAWNELGSPAVETVASGTGPHVSFSDTDGGSRWGDYSFAVPDPDGSGIWLATEYIPPATDQDPYDNWGTYVFEVPSK